MSPLERTPAWARGALAGLFYGGAMFAWSRWQADPPPLAVSMVVGPLGGVVFGSLMGLMMVRQERQLFQIGGRTLTGDQRVAVRRALAQGRLPADPLLRQAAVNLATSQFRRINSPLLVAALVVVFGGLAGWLALSGQPLWWLGVVFWIGMGAFMLYGQRRNRRRAFRLLQARDGVPITAER